MEMILEQNYWQKLRRYNHLSRPNNLEICLTITTMTIHARYKVLYYKFYTKFPRIFIHKTFAGKDT